MNVVYNIQCQNCESNYVGQTKRQLNNRIKEHKNYVKKANQNSVIAEHFLQTGHEFDWSSIRILDKKPNYNKRLTSEMLHIKLQQHPINKMTDTEMLDNLYLPLLNLLTTMSTNNP